MDFTRHRVDSKRREKKKGETTNKMERRTETGGRQKLVDCGEGQMEMEKSWGGLCSAVDGERLKKKKKKNK